MCEEIAKRTLLNYAIIKDIPFDVGQVIEDGILHNRDAKMNLGHPFLIYGLCKRAGVPLEDNEAPLRLYRSSVRNRVYYDLRGHTTRAMSPRTRMSSTSIRLILASQAIPRVTLGSPLLTHHHHSRPLRRRPHPVLPLI